MFWEFCAIRQEEWRNRNAGGPPPYTTDKVLRVKSIPNVFRELDRETMWMHSNIDSRKPADAIYGSIAFRLTCRIPLHEAFGGIPTVDQHDEWVRYLHEARGRGDRIFTRIYWTPHLYSYIRSMDTIAEHIDMITAKVTSADKIQDTFNALRELPSIRNFFAWQVTADLLEAKVNTFDEDSWCFLGPGPIHAFHLMYNERMTQSKAMVIARKYREVQHRALANTQTPWIPPPHIPEITLKNVEHALCEYFRWVSAHWRIG